MSPAELASVRFSARSFRQHTTHSGPKIGPQASPSRLGVRLRRRCGGVRVLEDLLHRKLEDDGDAVSEIQGGIVLFRLDGVHRLTGNAQALAELLLRPASTDAELPQLVLQARVRRRKGETAP